MKTNSRSLNELVIRADTEEDEWTFKGEVWSAIDKLIEAAYQEGLKASNPKP